MHIDITNSFDDRFSSDISDEKLQRIKTAYLLSKRDQVGKGDLYQVNREWIPIYNGYMHDLIRVMNEGSLDDLRLIYGNFFRHPCSTGLHGMHFDMVETYINKTPNENEIRSYMDSSIRYLELFLLNCRPHDIKKLHRKMVGNPYGVNLIDGADNVFIYGGAEYQYYYASRIKMLLGKNSQVLELGGGFGGLGSYLLMGGEVSQYIAIDLPENAALQAYYLMSIFPEKEFYLYGEINHEIADKYQNSVIILPNFCIEKLPDNLVELSFNSYSLAEMSYPSANNYIRQMCRFSSQYIYHVNHTRWEVSADMFDVDYDKFDLFLRFPTMWGRNLDNPKIDHHDFIYKKVCDFSK